MKPLGEKIAAEIRDAGSISFARFMDLALYCPVYGYYEQKMDSLGRQGDFFTSVSVGPLFGELLAFQFAAWFDAPPCPPAVHLVEAGAHDGQLALDILTWLRTHRPSLLDSLQYWILEPSPRRQAWQQQNLASFSASVHWAQDFQCLPSGSARRIIFANELLDAFPVHRLGWDAQRQTWFEWGVTGDEGRFVWAKGPPGFGSSPEPGLLPTGIPRELQAVLPDGFTLETCPAAERWWRAAAESLSEGKLLTADYGFTAEERLRPERKDGTLRAYLHHQANRDLLTCPGEQDLTAHVDFATILAAGESAGLRTEALQSQGPFLTAVAAKAWQPDSGFGQWTPARTRQFQTLTHPEHLGRSFRILVQSR